MQTPIEIDFKGFTGSDAQKAAIARHLDEVEQRFERIISGRIHVKSPDKHHRKGAAFETSIRLKLPAGREVDVSRTPGADERHANFSFALADAFRRAERQLHDRVERIQGEVKTVVGMPIGIGTRLFDDHCFLESADGLEICFHRNSVVNHGFGKLEPGSRVTCVEEPGEKGPRASTAERLGKHGLR
jgi:cold shock CspA family protein